MIGLVVVGTPSVNNDKSIVDKQFVNHDFSLLTNDMSMIDLKFESIKQEVQSLTNFLSTMTSPSLTNCFFNNDKSVVDNG